MVGACPLYRRSERAGLGQNPELNQNPDVDHTPDRDPVSPIRPGR
jgi:hypothetical protein